jgi:hypothetical protein
MPGSVTTVFDAEGSHAAKPRAPHRLTATIDRFNMGGGP